MYEWKTIKELRYWVNKVLPLVYDDSLSYYELLNKVVVKLNDLIANNKEIPDFVATMIEEYISSGEIENVVATVLSKYIVCVTLPPDGLEPMVNDGSEDNTDAFNALIEYAENNNTSLYFPDGVYLTGSVNVDGSIGLYGNNRYTTRIVLKGGSENGLFVGNSATLSINNITVDGNLDAQSNNISVVSGSYDSIIVENSIIKGGYKGVDINVTSDAQICDTIFTDCVNSNIAVTGTGICNVSSCILKSLNSYYGNYHIDCGCDNSTFSSLTLLGNTPNVICSGDDNYFDLRCDNTTYTDNGTNNIFYLHGNGNSVNKTNNITTHFSTLEANGESVELNAQNEVNNVDSIEYNSNGIVVNTDSFDLNSVNPIKYKTPETYNAYFKTIPMLDREGNEYNVLVEGANLPAITVNLANSYPTKNALVADGENLSEGRVYAISGFYSVNDGGGGLYIIVSNSSETKFNFQVGAGKYAELITDGRVNVRQTGARGDGVEDDTEALEWAFKYQHIIIPDGTFNYGGTFKYKSGQTVEGFDRENCILYLTNRETGIVSNVNAEGDPVILNFTMRNLMIKFTNRNRLDVPIKFNESRRLRIENCTFYGDTLENEVYSIIEVGRNFSSSAGCWSHRFFGNYFYHCRINWYNNTDSWFCNNDINSIEREYSARFSNAPGLIISENQFIAPLKIENSQGMQIIGNYFDGFVAHTSTLRWNAINCSGTIRKILFTNNRFYEIPGSGISINSNAQDITITNNIFELCDCFGDGLADINITHASTPCVINNNMGNRITVFHYDGETVTSENRNANTARLAAFLYCGTGGPNIVNGNVMHNGYGTTGGVTNISSNNFDKANFANHFYGNINSASGLLGSLIIGETATFQNVSAIIAGFPFRIVGRYHIVEVALDSSNIAKVTGVWTIAGSAVSDISGYAVSVSHISN